MKIRATSANRTSLASQISTPSLKRMSSFMLPLPGANFSFRIHPRCVGTDRETRPDNLYRCKGHLHIIMVESGESNVIRAVHQRQVQISGFTPFKSQIFRLPSTSPRTYRRKKNSCLITGKFRDKLDHWSLEHVTRYAMFQSTIGKKR